MLGNNSIIQDKAIGDFLHDIITSDELLSFHATIYPEKNTWVRLAYESLDNVVWTKSGVDFVEALREFAKDTTKSCWVSLAEYKKPQVSNMNIALIKCNFLCIPFPSNKTNSDLVDEIVSYCKRSDMFIPSAIVSAFDSCYIEWFYVEPMKGSSIGHWQKMQKKLCKLFKRFNPIVSCNPHVMLRVTGFQNNDDV